MTVALIVIIIALIVLGIAALVVAGRRAERRAVPVEAAAGRGPMRDEAFSSTGAVEIIGPAAVAPPVAAAPEPAAEAKPLFDVEREPDVAPPPAEIRWCNAFDRRSGTLDDTARLRLIGDLGVVARDWCVPLLCQAYEQEARPANRQAALIALAACRSSAAIPTYRLALASGDAHERAIAADALADLEPPPSIKPRTFVERR